MINITKTELDSWLRIQASNPPKVEGRLEKVRKDGGLICRCCLGNLCAALIPTTFTFTAELDPEWVMVAYGTSKAPYTLPFLLAKRLNISQSMEFTEQGKRYTKIFLRENNVNQVYDEGKLDDLKTWLSSLANVNDRTNADHILIGMLVEHLTTIERERGISCFIEYQEYLLTKAT